MNDRKMATPHYKTTAKSDFVQAATITVVLAFICGSMMGAAIALEFVK